jgi:hypothetical protein
MWFNRSQYPALILLLCVAVLVAFAAPIALADTAHPFTFDGGDPQGWHGLRYDPPTSSWVSSSQFRLEQFPTETGTPCSCPWTQEWSWVAYGPGGFPVGSQLAIESDLIIIDPNASSYVLAFDVYRNLPFSNGVFYSYSVSTESGVWMDSRFIYYGIGGEYRHTIDITSMVTPGATWMKIRLRALESFFYPSSHTAAPFFDNIDITEVGVGGGAPAILTGTVSGGDPPAGLNGVKVNAIDDTGSIAGTAYTDGTGHYEIPDLIPGTYTASLVTPLGYVGDSEFSTTLGSGETVTIGFSLSELTIEARPRGAGYWKQVILQMSPREPLATAISLDAVEAGFQAETTSPVCDYLDVIATHFNGNIANPVEVYIPPASGECVDKLAVAADLLNVKGNEGMEAKAKKHLMTLLLNAASGGIHLTEPVSADGATVSQAITYCDNQIDSGGSLELAKDIADYINNGRTVPAGWIPLETPIIAYTRTVPRGTVRPTLAQNLPNPFRSTTAIRFRLPESGSYTLSVFSLTGALVRSYTGWNDGAAESTVTWDGRDGGGVRVAPGIYYYRLDSAGFRDTRKALLLH